MRRPVTRQSNKRTSFAPFSFVLDQSLILLQYLGFPPLKFIFIEPIKTLQYLLDTDQIKRRCSQLCGVGGV